MELIKDRSLTVVLQKKPKEVFLKWLLNHLSLKTRETYSQTLREFSEFLANHKIEINHPKDLKSLHIIAYRDFLKAGEQAPKTICRKLACISSVCDEMFFAQEIPSNPCSSVKRPKAEGIKEKTFITEREIKKLVALYPDENKLYQLQNKTFLSLLSDTAQRVSSLLNLKKKDVSFMGSIPVLHLKTKGGKQRLLPVPDGSARLLVKLLEYRKDDEYIFQATRGVRSANKPLTRIAIHAMIKTGLKRIKVNTKRSAHSFRRYAITRALETQPIETVSENIAFHSSIQQTAEYKKKDVFQDIEAHPLLKVFNEPKAKSEDWETPKNFFDKVDSIFDFQLDVASSHRNHKSKKYYVMENDGLKQSWQTEGSTWCNPPFSRNADFVNKAIEESLTGQTIVVLMPARTDTKYYHQAMKSPNITHRLDVAGRLQFNEEKAEFNSNFATMLLIFNGNKVGSKINELNELGYLTQLKI